MGRRNHEADGARRGDLQDLADRLDPVRGAMRVDEVLHDFSRRSSLRLCEKRAGQLQDFVGAAQLLDFALEILEALCLGRGDASTMTAVDFLALDPLEQGLQHAADLGCDRLDRGPQRGVLPAVLN